MILLNDKALPSTPTESDWDMEKKSDSKKELEHRGSVRSRTGEQDAPPSYTVVEEEASTSYLEPHHTRSPTYSSIAPSSRASSSSRPTNGRHGHSAPGSPNAPSFPSPIPGPSTSSQQQLRPYSTSFANGSQASSSLQPPALVPHPLLPADYRSWERAASTASFASSTTFLNGSSQNVNKMHTKASMSVTTVSTTATISSNSTVTPAADSSSLPPPPPPVFVPKHKKSWFNSTNKKRTKKEARDWVLSQVIELVQTAQQTTGDYLETSRSVLGSCSEALSLCNLNLHEVLQEKFMESYTPLYWSIVQRPSTNDSSYSRDMPDLFRALLTFGSPLMEETRKDIRKACLMVNDQALFNAIRMSKDYFPLHLLNEAVFGGRIPPDEVIIEDRLPGQDPAFALSLEIPFFMQRMTVQKQVVLEFIAQRRLWWLSISAHPEKSDKPWKISISLLEHSPSTYIDSRFIIQDASYLSDTDSPITPSTEAPSSPSTMSYTSTAYLKSSKDQVPPQPSYFYPSNPLYPDVLRGSTNLVSTTVAPSPPHSPPQSPDSEYPRKKNSLGSTSTSTNQKRRKSSAPNSDALLPDLTTRIKSSSKIEPGKKGVEVSLDEPSSRYLSSDGTMKARFEARLAKPESECVIC